MAELITGIDAPGDRCSRCGAVIQLGDGICVSCFLQEGLETDGEASAEAFEKVLSEADVPDKAWRLGNYEIVRELGRGGMGAVFLAQRADEQYQKFVAIKLIKRGMDTDAVLRHFRTERQILANFDHPNIARLFDGGTTDSGLPYFVMEYVEGLPIDQYCDQHHLSIRDRLVLFREVCAAVSYAHRHLVIHRDIKRSNILVTSDGTPKLLDFGIAKILQQEGAQTLATMTGVRLMTPEYASPEQIRGEPVTTASDVYSLGVVLYELLTGTSPYRFTTQSTYEIARTIGETHIPKPSTAATSGGNSKLGPSRTGIFRNPKILKGDLDNIVLMALRKEPERRYQTVERFSEDIQRHLSARPVSARKDTIGYRFSTFARRNRAATAAGVLVALTLIGGIVATTWQAHRARLAKARAERRFNDVRQLARSVLFDYYDAIKDLPGATPVRDRLVKDALTYLDSLAREAGSDASLQRELAAAYERVGDVRGQTYSASLGDRVGAMESYGKALRIRESLVAAAPRDEQNRRDLAASYQRIGNLLLDTADGARGLEHLRKSLTICSELTNENRRRPELQRDLAESHNALGLALESRGDMPGALEHHHKALSIYKELLANNPTDRTNRRSLSVSYENIGRALFLSNDSTGALEHNRQALALREALAAEEPTNADYRRILAVSYQNSGDYLAWIKKIPEALESFRKKLPLDEQSIAADPANAQARSDLAYSCQRIGELLAQSGDYAQALPFHRRTLELREKIANADPQSISAKFDIAFNQAHVAEAEAHLGQFAAAAADCRKAADNLRTIKDDPGNADHRRSRVLTCGAVAEAYALVAADKTFSRRTAIEHWRVARDMYQQAVDIMRDLRSRGILDADEAKEIGITEQKVANCDAALAK